MFRLAGLQGRQSRALALTCFLAASPSLARATTILYRSDAELVALADRVVHAHVLSTSSEASAAGGTIVTVTRLAIIEDLTGVDTGILEIRELGGRANGVGLWVPGAPRFVVGQEVVVCLERANGSFRSVAMAFSAFTVRTPPGGAAPQLERFASEASVLGAPDAAVASRSLDEFRRVVAAVKGTRSLRAAIVEGEDAPAVAAPGRIDENFRLLGGGIRWREVDSGSPISWFRNSATPSPLTSGDTDTEIRVALSAWTNVASARIAPVFGGTRSDGGASQSLQYCTAANAGAGLITFGDPGDELSSGVLAIGGGCYEAVTHVVNGQSFYQFTHGYVVFNNDLSGSFTQLPNFTRVMTHEIGHGLGLDHTCEGAGCTTAQQVNIMYPSCCSTLAPLPPALGPDDREGLSFIYPEAADTDVDLDTLPDAWEVRFGLDPASGAGNAGAQGDPDSDGRSNAQEYAAGTHPRGFVTRYLAEGAVNAFFRTQLALLNPGATRALVNVRVQPEAETERSLTIEIPAATRRTLDAATLAAVANAPFATVIESDQLLVVDRTLSWDDTGYGAHAESALVAPSTTWYLAEGSTSGDFSLFYLLQNPGDASVNATVRFLRPAPLPPIDVTHVLPPRSRTTIPVDTAVPALASTDVSGVITASSPIIVERAMYLSRPGQPFAAGHGSAGATAPATEWFLAEGATGTFFELFLLIANPQSAAAAVDVDYLRPDGSVLTKSYVVGAQSRFTIWVDEEQFPAGSGNKALLAGSVAMRVRATNGIPVVVERSMWWPAPDWYEAHNEVGSTETGTRWGLAEGEVGGAADQQTYVLVANTSSVAGLAQVTLHFEDSTTSTLSVPIPANSRTNVSIAETFPAAANRRFGVTVQSVAAGASVPQLVVERAMYSNHGGVLWAAGTVALATRLAP